MQESKRMQAELEGVEHERGYDRDWTPASLPPVASLALAEEEMSESDIEASVIETRAALRGGVAFVGPDAVIARTTELLEAGALVVSVPPLSATLRGSLAAHLEEHLERALAAAGAPSAYLAAWSAMQDDADEMLVDQIFRARSVGASGIALVLGSLAAAAYPAVSAEDSGTLRWLARATTKTPLVVLLDDADTARAAYEAPVSLDALLTRATSMAPTPPASVPGDKARPAAKPRAAAKPASAPVAPDVSMSAAMARVFDEDEQPAVVAPISAIKPAPVTEASPPTDRQDRERERATVGVPVAGPTDTWRAWALALGAVRGPLPLAAFERLFAESYVPLANAIVCGLDDARATRAHDEFRRTFERAYTDAFATFGATNRRPRLVMDAYDVVTKQARLHSARASQVLVVDSMRWDLGTRFRDALARKVGATASFTSETTLWSALPTTTIRQLETIARGMDALRAPAAEEPQETLRGRTAEVVRRMRVGSRELYKLDVVPTLLGGLGDEPGAEAVVGALDDVADAIADSVARHMATLPPRTLVLVAGDHGFTVDRRGRILHGGASPEEVLVPAYAWLVSDLH